MLGTLNGATGILKRGEKDPDKETEGQRSPRGHGVTEIEEEDVSRRDWSTGSNAAT